MPACLTCGVRFRGRGSHCRLHYSGYDNLNTINPGPCHQRDSNNSATNLGGTGLHIESNNWRPHTTWFADSQDTYASYPNPDAIVLYKINEDMLQSNLVSVNLVQNLAQAFSTLTDAHHVTSLKYSVNLMAGTHTLTAETNLDRERCGVCRHWFPNHEKLGQHHQDCPVACEECSICLRPQEIWWHAENFKHGRCFVEGCGNIFRKEGGWKVAVVRRHVQKCHYYG